MIESPPLSVDPSIPPPDNRGGVRALSRAAALDLMAMAGLLGVGAWSFGSVYDSTLGYRAAFGGLLAGLTIALIGAWRRLGLLATAGVTALAYFGFGTALALPSLGVAGVIPTLSSLRRLLLLVVQGWRDLLTVSVPADDFVGPAVVPFLSALVLATSAGSIALRARRYLWALVPSALLLAVGILWGSKSASGAPAQGVLFGATALGWGSWRGSAARRAITSEYLEGDAGFSGTAVRRAAAAVATIAVAAGLASVVAPAWGATSNRHVLRDNVIAPFDPRAYASPLTQYRYLETDLKKQVLLTVTGLPAEARLRLATLDTFDGDVYAVEAASAGYLHIGSRVDVGSRQGKPTTIGVRVGKYAGIWLPGGGDVRAVRFTGDDAKQCADGLYYNSATGTVATTAGVGEGTAYEISVVLPTRPPDAQLSSATIRPVELAVPRAVPDAVAQTAADLAGEASTPYGQLSAIADRLRTEGFYANGEDAASRSGHTAERIGVMLAQPALVGDDEQYAVLMALMARQLGYPARVVMGFYPGATSSRAADGSVALTGADAHVWVEVAFQPDAWVAFDPTPDHDRKPQKEIKKQRLSPMPQVLNPPDPPRSDADRPLDYEGVAKPPQDDEGTPLWARIGKYVVLGAGICLALGSPLLVLLLLKHRRRRRRLTAPTLAERVSGSWEELRDATVDLGAPPLRSATRSEHAVALRKHFPDTDAAPIATAVDALVFSAAEPTPDDVRRMWSEVDVLLRGIRRSVPTRRRLRAVTSISSLRAKRQSKGLS